MKKANIIFIENMSHRDVVFFLKENKYEFIHLIRKHYFILIDLVHTLTSMDLDKCAIMFIDDGESIDDGEVIDFSDHEKYLIKISYRLENANK